MHHHTRSISRTRPLPRMAADIQPPQTLWGKIA